jgi:acetyl esterase/lipase
LTLLRKGRPVPGAVLAMSPWFDTEVEHAAVATHAHLDKQITRDQLQGFAALMLDGTGVSRADPRITLLNADPVVHAGYIDTDLVASLDVSKSQPKEIARRVVEAQAAGSEEVLADDMSRQTKAGLAADPPLYLSSGA